MLKTLLLSASLLVLSGGFSQADEQVRRVQEELRRRNLYFGEVDGRKTDETTSAIRRYQTRKNLPPSGDLTPGTLRSLDIAASGSAASEWPEMAVLKSDAAREVIESDRKVLEEMEAGDPPPVAEGPIFSRPLLEPVIGAHNPESVPASTPPPTGERPITLRDAGNVENVDSQKRIQDFVSAYLAACETNVQEDEMRFYGDRVDYFDQGMVSRDFVARDVQRFYKRWPHRQYQLLGLQVVPAPQGAWEAIFRIAFQYSRGEQKVSGKTLNHFRVQPTGESLHFTALREQRVRN